MCGSLCGGILFYIPQRPLDLPGAHANQLVQLLSCLVQPALCGFQHSGELAEFTLDRAEHFPYFSRSLLYRQRAETQL